MNSARHYRKRPTVVEAVQWLGEQNCEEVFAFLGWNHNADETDHSVIYLDGIDENWTAEPGDWIVRTPDGDRYPVKPEAFARDYEPAGGAR